MQSKPEAAELSTAVQTRSSGAFNLKCPSSHQTRTDILHLSPACSEPASSEKRKNGN